MNEPELTNKSDIHLTLATTILIMKVMKGSRKKLFVSLLSSFESKILK